MASVLSAPFLVAPSESTSTPARHVSSAGVHPSAATRVGDAGAVHVHAQRTAPRRRRRRRATSARRVRRAVVGRAGERHDRRLGVVGIAPARRVERRRHRVRRQPERRAGEPAHDGAAAEQRRRPTLAVEDVRRLVAQHGAPRRAQRRQPERVRRRAADDREHGDVGVLEDVGDALAQARRPLVGRRRRGPSPRRRRRRRRGSPAPRRRRCRCAARSHGPRPVSTRVGTGRAGSDRLDLADGLWLPRRPARLGVPPAGARAHVDLQQAASTSPSTAASRCRCSA